MNENDWKWWSLRHYTHIPNKYILLTLFPWCLFNLIHYFSLPNVPSFFIQNVVLPKHPNHPTCHLASPHLVEPPPPPKRSLPLRGELLKNPSPANIPIDPLAPSERPVWPRQVDTPFWAYPWHLQKLPPNDSGIPKHKLPGWASFGSVQMGMLENSETQGLCWLFLPGRNQLTGVSMEVIVTIVSKLVCFIYFF